MILYLLVSGTLLTHLRRPISRLTVTEQRLEGDFRYVNSRLITNSEEVAFYQGNKREKKNIDSSFMRLVCNVISCFLWVDLALFTYCSVSLNDLLELIDLPLSVE